jgi:hypothetical protein
VPPSILAAEHRELLQGAIDLTAHLGTARERLVPTADTAYVQHMEFGERVWSLHVYLQGALGLLDHDVYQPALATLRSALEHYVQDHLLFLGNRYRAIVRDVSDETLADGSKRSPQDEMTSKEYSKLGALMPNECRWFDPDLTSPARDKA